MRPQNRRRNLVLAAISCAMVVCAMAFEGFAEAPDLWVVDSGDRFELDMRHGDPFRIPYNATLNPNEPSNIPVSHDSSHDFYLFEPARTNGKPIGERPLVVYFHGADTSPSPEKQRQQILHYVREGFLVAWMPFCDTRGLCLDFVFYDDNASAALADLLTMLATEQHVNLARNMHGEPLMGFVAHSLGAHVATRVAGADDAAAPQAIILHDGAGYDASIAGPIESLGLPRRTEAMLIELITGFIEMNGWGWDDPNNSVRTYQIKHALPLDADALAGIPPTTLLLALGASESEFGPNAVETVRRIFHRVSSEKKVATIVPHVCASENSVDGRYVYACPGDISGPVDTALEHVYYSQHDLFSGVQPNRLFDSAVLLQTTNCLLETTQPRSWTEHSTSIKKVDSTEVTNETKKDVDAGQPNAVESQASRMCTGDGRDFTGVWMDESGALLRRASFKHPWLLSNPDE